jgi:hypothetical protein
MKVCSKCKKSKLLKEFAVKSVAPDGRQSFCKKCLAKIMKIRYSKNPEIFKKTNEKVRSHVSEYINKLKEKMGCKFCLEKEPICLDFHHIEKKVKGVSY